MDSAVKAPLSERLNFRIVIFGVVMLAVIGYPIYLYLEESITGGIIHRDGYEEVNLQSMSTFSFDQENGTFESIPKKWRDLNGKKVLLKGEMYSPDSAGDDVRRFDLVYSISKCCVTPNPQIQHFIKSRVVNNGTVPFYGQQVRVMGTLRVDVKKNDEGAIVQVFALDVEKVEKI